jgi:hypothetical protein
MTNTDCLIRETTKEILDMKSNMQDYQIRKGEVLEVIRYFESVKVPFIS